MRRFSSLSARARAAAALVALLGGCDPTAGVDSPEPASSSQAAVPCAGSHASAPTLSGPVTGGRLGTPFTAMPIPLQQEYGYVEEEFFLEGTATAYAAQGALPSDGRFSLSPASTSAYKTRLLVRRPKDPARFSGTVVVEWFNVTGGLDADVDFRWLQKELLRSGDVYVGVSAQRVGVEGGGPGIPGIPGIGGTSLKAADPERYGSLRHPGDHYSYDIFTQVGRALRAPGAIDPLHGLEPEQLIAVGESQSAARLAAYVNGVHPLVSVYDGFLIHSRGGGTTDFGPSSPIVGFDPILLRTDLAQPVLQVETETDIVTLGFLAARQPDTDALRTWEIAGSSHAERILAAGGIGGAPAGGAQADFAAALCPAANQSHQVFVLRRALADLRTWVATGESPASGPLLEIEGGAFERDAHGNALGGIRTPAVDVPIATHSGLPAPGAAANLLCSLFGSRVPFSAEKLRALYPTRDDYLSKVEQATDAAIAAGFLLAADKGEILAEAERAGVPPE